MAKTFTKEDLIKLRKKAIQKNKEVAASYPNEKYWEMTEENDHLSLFALEIEENGISFHFHFLQNERTDRNRAIPYVTITTADGRLNSYCYQIKNNSSIKI